LKKRFKREMFRVLNGEKAGQIAGKIFEEAFDALKKTV